MTTLPKPHPLQVTLIPGSTVERQARSIRELATTMNREQVIFVNYGGNTGPVNAGLHLQSPDPSTLLELLTQLKGKIVLIDGILFSNFTPEQFAQLRRLQVNKLVLTWPEPVPEPKTWAGRVQRLPEGTMGKAIAAAHGIAQAKLAKAFGHSAQYAAYSVLFYDEDTWEKALKQATLTDDVLDIRDIDLMDDYS